MKKDNTWKVAAILLLIVLFLIGVYGFYHKDLNVGASPSNWGSFGDYFGGIFNPIVGFLSVILIYLAYIKNLEINNQIKKQVQNEVFLLEHKTLVKYAKDADASFDEIILSNWMKPYSKDNIGQNYFTVKTKDIPGSRNLIGMITDTKKQRIRLQYEQNPSKYIQTATERRLLEGTDDWIGACIPILNRLTDLLRAFERLSPASALLNEIGEYPEERDIRNKHVETISFMVNEGLFTIGDDGLSQENANYWGF